MGRFVKEPQPTPTLRVRKKKLKKMSPDWHPYMPMRILKSLD
jgi:hypothetical protein